MTVQFPPTPTIDQTVSGPDGSLWRWDGQKWVFGGWGGGEWSPGPMGPPGIQGPPGPAGTSVNIMGSLSDQSLLPTDANLGEAYLINGELWVWTAAPPPNHWENVGNIQGPQGPPGFVPEPFGPDIYGRTQAGQWQSVTQLVNGYLPLTGGTMTGNITTNVPASQEVLTINKQGAGSGISIHGGTGIGLLLDSSQSTPMLKVQQSAGNDRFVINGDGTVVISRPDSSTAMTINVTGNASARGIYVNSSGSPTTGSAIEINSVSGPFLTLRNGATPVLQLLQNGGAAWYVNSGDGVGIAAHNPATSALTVTGDNAVGGVFTAVCSSMGQAIWAESTGPGWVQRIKCSTSDTAGLWIECQNNYAGGGSALTITQTGVNSSIIINDGTTTHLAISGNGTTVTLSTALRTALRTALGIT